MNLLNLCYEVQSHVDRLFLFFFAMVRKKPCKIRDSAGSYSCTAALHNTCCAKCVALPFKTCTVHARGYCSNNYVGMQLVSYTLLGESCICSISCKDIFVVQQRDNKFPSMVNTRNSTGLFASTNFLAACFFVTWPPFY